MLNSVNIINTKYTLSKRELDNKNYVHDIA